MIFQPQLRIPGPTPLPERVVRAMARPMIDHRGPEFARLLGRVTEGLQRVFETSNDVLVFSSSGTGGLESAVANLVSPGDTIVVAVCGNFGERFAALGAAFGAAVVRVDAEWGEAVAPAALAAALDQHPQARLVFITHNETSTGVTNDLAALVRVARERDRLTVVDGVSSVGSMPIAVDALGVDVAVSASQKGWMAPPGLAFVSVGERAWAHQSTSRGPRFYWDWAEMRKLAAQGSTPYTPAISVFHAVEEGLAMLEEEGLAAVFARHRRLAGATAAGLEAIGLRLFAASGHRSAVVTSAVPPEGLDVAAYRRLLDQRYGVVIAGGQGKMTGRMIRVGHLGAVTEGDVVQVLWAMERGLEDLDIAASDGRGLAAATAALAGTASVAR